MYRLLFLPALFLLFFSCKKTIEKIQQNIIVDAMTSGQWKVVSFTQNSTSRTADFTGFSFQFQRDRTVEAIKDNAVVENGVWEGYPENRTILSLFQNAEEPVNLLNGTWKVDENSWSYVEASRNEGGQNYRLRLEKL